MTKELPMAVVFGVVMTLFFLYPGVAESKPISTPKEAIQMELGGLPVMTKIARAESNFVPTAKNPTSTASGLFQILHGTWVSNECTGDVFNPTDNVVCAGILYERYGTDPWLASKSIWSKSL